MEDDITDDSDSSDNESHAGYVMSCDMSCDCLPLYII